MWDGSLIKGGSNTYLQPQGTAAQRSAYKRGTKVFLTKGLHRKYKAGQQGAGRGAVRQKPAAAAQGLAQVRADVKAKRLGTQSSAVKPSATGQRAAIQRRLAQTARGGNLAVNVGARRRT